MSAERPPARPWYDLVMQQAAVKGWGVAELARRAKVGRPTIYGWRDNPGKPQAKSVNAVADVLGIDRARAVRLAGIVGSSGPEREPAGLQVVIDAIRSAVEPDRQQQAIDAVERELRGEPHPPSPPTESGGAAGSSEPPRRAG